MSKKRNPFIGNSKVKPLPWMTAGFRTGNGSFYPDMLQASLASAIAGTTDVPPEAGWWDGRRITFLTPDQAWAERDRVMRRRCKTDIVENQTPDEASGADNPHPSGGDYPHLEPTGDNPQLDARPEPPPMAVIRSAIEAWFANNKGKSFWSVPAPSPSIKQQLVPTDIGDSHETEQHECQRFRFKNRKSRR